MGDPNEPGLGKSGMTRMEDAIPATRASTDAIATAVPRRRPQVMRAPDPAPATRKTAAEAGPRGGRGSADAAAADGVKDLGGAGAAAAGVGSGPGSEVRVAASEGFFLT